MSDLNIAVQKNILIVDDELDSLDFLSRILTHAGYTVRSINNSVSAIAIAHSSWADLILLDINMPEINGYEVCKRIKAKSNIPVIFLTSTNETLDKVKAFNCGGADYINRPFQSEEILTKVKNQLELKAAQNKIRQLNRELETKVKERTKYLKQKINELEQSKSTLNYAFQDRLTNLPNQLGLSQHLESEIIAAKKAKEYKFAVLLIQFDWEDTSQLKSHFAEPKLIMSITKRLSSILRQTDTLNRIGSNKFTVVLSEIFDTNQVTRSATQILEQFSSPVSVAREKIQVGLNIGVVLYSSQHQKPAHILRDAKIAVHQAQKRGLNCHYLLNESARSY